jgi:hypothetical protein
LRRGGRESGRHGARCMRRLLRQGPCTGLAVARATPTQPSPPLLITRSVAAAAAGQRSVGAQRGPRRRQVGGPVGDGEAVVHGLLQGFTRHGGGQRECVRVSILWLGCVGGQQTMQKTKQNQTKRKIGQAMRADGQSLGRCACAVRWPPPSASAPPQCARARSGEGSCAAAARPSHPGKPSQSSFCCTVRSAAAPHPSTHLPALAQRQVPAALQHAPHVPALKEGGLPCHGVCKWVKL